MSWMIDYDEVPLRRFHLRIGVAGTGGVFADGFGLGIIGIALTLATPALRLTSSWQGLLGGASLAGLFLGALLTGPVADRFGRRRIFASNMVLAALLSLLQFAVTSGAQLLLLRLTIGFLLGTDYVVSKTLLTEFVPRRLRGRVLSLLSIAWAGGYACAYAVGFFLTQLGPDAWRWMLVTGAVPCLLIAPLRFGVPESPLWLIEHGRGERAAQIVRERLGGGVRLPLHLPRAVRVGGRWAQLFGRRWRTRTLVACTFFTCQVIPYFAVGTFVTQVMAALRLRGSYVGGLIYNLALLLGAIGGVLIIDRISRRCFLIGSFLTAAIAMSLLGLAPSAAPGGTIVLFAIFAAVLSAASNLVYVYLPELFATDLRASGIGLAVAASRIGSAVSTFLLPVMVEAYGVRSALGACVAVLTIGAVVCYCWAPETRNLSLLVLDQGALEQGALRP
ncbi:MAG TPA: MFS transporter [Steroidobacteraceae bacterium]|nr:MFS transporter [Steroidobacteraceae bacterium]